MKQRIEILAPAGGDEQLTAALRSGADAVYLGLKAFNARMGAENFGDLSAVVSRCHERSVRVYVTFNTLIQEKELKDAVEALRQIAQSGVDGILVTDMGAVLLASACCPSLPLHASTQMTVHNRAGCALLKEMNFRRAVLAREMTREEIRAVTQRAGLETEVFVHGALCMSVSGQCLLSSVLGGRSGNRGRCAQPCRLNFASGRREYALSLKDLSLIDRLSELEEMGVTSAKIEGRLKRPEYVAAAVDACRRTLNGEKTDTEQLRNLFSRSGFTAGYYDGRRDLSMFGIRTESDAQMTRQSLSSVHTVTRTEYASVPLDMTLTLRPDTASVLRVSDGVHSAEVSGAFPQPAQTRPLTEDDAAAALGKLGGTPYFARKIACLISPGLYLSKADLSALRREGIEQIAGQRAQCRPHPFREAWTPPQPCAQPSEPLRYAYLENADQLSDELISFFNRIFLPLRALSAPVLARLGNKAAGRIPALLFGKEEDRCAALLRELRQQGLTWVSVGNPGGIFLAREQGFRITGEYRLNALNSLALEQYRRLQVSECDLSPESTLQNTKAIRSPIPIGMLVYGFLPLMSWRCCPCQGEKGCADCRGKEISDRRGTVFPVLCRKTHSLLLNSVPLWLGDRRSEMPAHHHDSFLFTRETLEECMTAVKRWQKEAAWDAPFTRGLFERELL